jgi:hypothetical protein
LLLVEIHFSQSLKASLNFGSHYNLVCAVLFCDVFEGPRSQAPSG